MSEPAPIFADRRDAGRRLAAALRFYVDQEPLVLALPRGGVPVAFEIADELAAPLDLLFVRRIALPGHPDVGLGALVDGPDPQLVLAPEMEGVARLPEGYLEEELKQGLREIDRRRRAYLDRREPLDVRGRTVLLVDDGVVTGITIRAALRGLETAGASRLVLALPVGPGEVIASLGEAADEVVCLATPDPFNAVAAYYGAFLETEDEKVVALLRRARRRSIRRSADEAPRPAADGPADPIS
jgi:putative phosphoribosyl transferase